MKLVHAGAALAGMLAVASCASSAGPSDNGGAGSGMVRIMLTDSPFSDAKAVLVTFTEVSAHRSGGSWEDLTFAEAAVSRTCDLKKLEGPQDLLGVGPLVQGHYTQLRLTVSTAVLYFDSPSVGPACAPAIAAPLGTKATANVPSGTIKLNRQFEVATDGMTTIVLDFDGDKSINKLGNGSYQMKPVIAVLSVG